MIRHANNNLNFGSFNLSDILFIIIKFQNKHMPHENTNLILYLQDSASSDLLAAAIVWLLLCVITVILNSVSLQS